MKNSFSRSILWLLALLMCVSICSPLAACGEETLKTYDYPDWGLSIGAPESWLYQAGQLPPKADRPFRPSTGTLSSRDTFPIGLWASGSSDFSPAVRMLAFYTSAGTVERIEGVKDKMMQMLVERSSANGRKYQAGTFEIIDCGDNRAACFSMTLTYQGTDYVLWDFLLPFKMTVLQLEGYAPADGDTDIKQVLTDMMESVKVQ